MIIDSEKLSGMCTCGREHKMTTELCIIESGCMANIDTYLKRCNLGGTSVAIYDENTYSAKGLVRPRVDFEIVLAAEGLHADDHGVDLVMQRLPEKFDYLIAVGAGSIHDITRYCAYTKDVPFVSCPTAASVDGFCSSVAAMTWHGFKKTLTALAPRLVIADLDVISQAPMFLSKSGFCDLIGKFIALADWRVGNTLTGEYLCERIYGMTMDATLDVARCTEGIRDGEPDAYAKLIYGLLMSGLAMQLLGNSRCASGAEHHISHLIEMRPVGLGVSSDALHGEKVGVGTLLVAREYHKMKNNGNISFGDYKSADSEYIEAMFGTLADSVIEENRKDAAGGITAARIKDVWSKICDIISDIPSAEELEGMYSVIGAKSTLSDIDVPEDKLNTLLEYSPLVRNRLTLMRLRRAVQQENA